MITINTVSYPLECVYQASKVFNDSIKFEECLKLSPLEAKKTIMKKRKKNIYY